MAQGAAMAMEDALVLAETLTTTSTIDDALAQYTYRRLGAAAVPRAGQDAQVTGWGRIPLLKLAGNMLYKRSYIPLTEPI